MAYRLTIKLTKTDTNPWWFLEPNLDSDTAQKMDIVKNNGLDILNNSVITPTEAIFTKDFEDKNSVNRYLVRMMSTDQFSNEAGIAAHPGGWKEEITTEEI